MEKISNGTITNFETAFTLQSPGQKIKEEYQTDVELLISSLSTMSSVPILIINEIIFRNQKFIRYFFEHLVVNPDPTSDELLISAPPLGGNASDDLVNDQEFIAWLDRQRFILLDLMQQQPESPLKTRLLTSCTSFAEIVMNINKLGNPNLEDESKSSKEGPSLKKVNPIKD